ncbi:MAG TPA: hypothetical protein PLU35_02970 [Phycisphaerales bacterium]|nr:hypothetical protein [Phycisphaerales bacterium]
MDAGTRDTRRAQAAARLGSGGEVVVTLWKGRHTWRFSCRRGDEATLMRAVAKLTAGQLTVGEGALVARQIAAAMAGGDVTT